MADFSYHRVRYSRDKGLEDTARQIVRTLGWDYIDMDRVAIMRSSGTKSKRILARCHALTRIFQHALGVNAHYVIEMLSENFDKLPEEEKVRTIIHELMHIPKSFAGGFRHHAPYVTRRTVDRAYKEYLKARDGY